MVEDIPETVHPLYGYMVRRTGGNRVLTEDIGQESHLRALKHWNQMTSPDSPLAWLKRVARNILIDFLGQKKWDRKVDLDFIPDSGQKKSKEQFKSLKIFLAITSLGRKKSKIIEAFYHDRMSVREGTNEMAISERAVEGE